SPHAPRAVQPHVLDGNQVLIASEADFGLALFEVRHDGSSWNTKALWTSKDMKPSFNDCVVHKGHAYGFDGPQFCCVDLKTGKRCWKAGRYGHGQVVLLADQGLLLVLSETGDAILVPADPTPTDEPRELGRFKALEGKTWNHPVLAHDRLFVRNAKEMACYE